MRDATDADVDAIVAMAQRFLASSTYAPHVLANPTHMRTLALHLIDSPDGTVIVAEHDETLVGMIGCLCYPHVLSGVRVCGELVWWVEPEHRGIGLRLLDDAEQWARDHGALEMHMVAPTVDVERIYARRGYTPLERTFTRAL